MKGFAARSLQVIVQPPNSQWHLRRVLQCAHSSRTFGDFSALLQGPNPIQLYNPFTTRPDPANPGSFIRDPFPNNDISSVLNPGAVSLAKAVFPAPQPVVNGFNGYDLRSNLTPQNQYSFRVDHNFNPSNSVFFRYTSSDQTRVGTGGIVGETATGETFGKQYVLSYYHQFNPSTILDAQFGHVDLTNNVGNAYDNLDPTTVVNDAGLAPDFACGFTGTSWLLDPRADHSGVRD